MKKLGKLRSLRVGAKRRKYGKGKEEKAESERDEASSGGQFVHNVNCSNYYDIIIHPNCTANRHAKCLIASSGGWEGCRGRRAEGGDGGWRERYMQLN